jgi:hypothetical protein
MKQTAVEWLWRKLSQYHMANELNNDIAIDLYIMAIEKEKKYLEQLKDFETWKEWKNKQQ